MKKPMTVVVSALCAAVAFGADYYVDYANGLDEEGRGGLDAPFKTIAYAVGKSVDNDTIYLAANTHQIAAEVVVDKAVRIVGLGDDRTKVILKRTASCRILSIGNAKACIANLTLNANSSGNVGHGSCAYVASGTVSNCVLRGCATGTRSCVYLEKEDAVLVDCQVSNNSCYDDTVTPGVWVKDGLVLRCVLKDNTSRKRGAGGWLNGANARLFDSVVENNTACLNWFHNGGGGILVLNSGAVISNCVFRGNKVNHGKADSDDNAYYNGGAIYFAKAGKAYACVITNNTAWGFGGAVYGPGELHNCLIAGNHSMTRSGGGTYGLAKLSNCTVADCTARGVGGVSGAATLRNSIVWNNVDVTDAEKPVESNWDTATFAYSCTRPLPDGEGNLCTDPRFFSRRKVGDYLVDCRSSVGKGGEGRTWMGWRAYAVPGLRLLVR